MDNIKLFYYNIIFNKYSIVPCKVCELTENRLPGSKDKANLLKFDFNFEKSILNKSAAVNPWKSDFREHAKDWLKTRSRANDYGGKSNYRAPKAPRYSREEVC